MSDNLRIALLGPLVVMRAGKALPESAWRSRQERRLLGILLTARGMRVPIDQLIDWLWPEADKEAAAVTLRSTISSLRHTLEPEAGARASTRYILTRPGGYAWNAESGAWIDRDEYQECLQSHQHSPMRSQNLARAIELYRGDYLEDEPAAPWAVGERERLREQYLTALADLAELQLAKGESASAIRLAQRGLAYDRLREPLYRALMRAQTYAGDVAGALQSYERYRRALDDELGAVPSAQTQALHTAILRGEVGRQADQPGDQTAVRLKAPSPDPPPPSALSVAQSTPFIGRAQELASLHGWIDELAQGRGGVVALIGEAGIGKTRLATEALRVAIARGALGITLRCAALERGRPFAPLSEALRPLLRAAPAETLRRLPPAALDQVAALLPVLRERLPDLPALTPPTGAAPAIDSHNRLLDGLVDLALALARDAPLVVVCDDAQWADEATLAVLGRLGRHTRRHALLLILTYRSEELAENTALHALLRALGREMLLRPLVLGRFETAEVTQFLAGIAHVQEDRLARLAPRLAERSRGNPLFLGVAVQSLLESRGVTSLAALLPELDAGAPLPDLAGAPQIRDLVLARLERLPASPRALLEQLAVIGRPVSLDLIEQLAGTPGLETAQTLLERQFLFEDADGRLEFGHDLVRSIIVTTLASPRRRLLHRHAAEAIAALHGDQPEQAAELAFHFGQAGRDAEAAVLRYATAAGDQARRTFGYRAALAHYDTALQAATRLGVRASVADVRRAFAGRLVIYETLLDWEGIMDTSARYDRWAAQHADQPPLVHTRRLVLLHALLGDLAGAATISAEQSRRQPAAPPAVQDMLWRTAIVLQPIEPPRMEDGGWRMEKTRDPPSSILHPPFVPAHPLPGAPAEDLPASLGADEAALVLFQVGWAALMQGLLDDAEPCLLRAYELAVETSQPAVAVVSALQLGHLGALRGEVGATQHWLTNSLDLARRAPEAAWATIWPSIHQAYLLLTGDQYAAAQELFEQVAAQLHEQPAFQSHRASVEAGLGLLALARGDTAQAAERLASALASPQLLYGFVYVSARLGLARLASMHGDLVTARATLGHALDYSARRSLLPEYIRTAIEIARIERDFGDPAPALPLLRTAADLAATAGLGPLGTAANALLVRLQG